MPLTVKEAEDLFNKMDQNSDGKCSIHEVKKFLQAFCAETYGDKSDQEFCVSSNYFVCPTHKHISTGGVGAIAYAQTIAK